MMDTQKARQTIIKALETEIDNGLMRIDGGWETIQECQEEARVVSYRLNILRAFREGRLTLTTLGG